MNFRMISTTLALALLPLAYGCGDPDPRQEEPLIIPADSGNGTMDPDAGGSDSSDTDDPAQNNSDDAGTSEDAADTPDMNGTADMAEDPCGNGVLDPGETCDGDCPTSCDDDNDCTEDTLTGDPDACTSECEHQPVAACDAYEGSYSGSYFIKAEEKLGSSVINSVTCTGTFDATVDVAAEDQIDGSANCSYSGSLGGFSSSQSATFTGDLAPDGTFSGRLVHDFGTDNDGSFSIDGTLDGGSLVVDDTGSFKPNSFSAVPWDVEIKLGVN